MNKDKSTPRVEILASDYFEPQVPLHIFNRYHAFDVSSVIGEDGIHAAGIQDKNVALLTACHRCAYFDLNLIVTGLLEHHLSDLLYTTQNTDSLDNQG